MLHIRDNHDGSKRVLTQDEANSEDITEALLNSGAPFTILAWLPAGVVVWICIFGYMSNHGDYKLLGAVFGMLFGLPATVVIGVLLKRVLGPLSGVLGLGVAYFLGGAINRGLLG